MKQMKRWLLDARASGPCFACVEKKYGVLGIEVFRDPRTGKPWRSMKAAREWFDEMQELCKEIYKP
jgi:hypothetical protein